MIEEDTIKLLRECDAGVKMGVRAIDDVIGYVQSKDLKECQRACKETHTGLDREIQAQLERFHDEGKAPGPIAESMSWMKTNMKLAMHRSDQTIADLMTDGCHMGIKSLNRYLNQYKAADERTKDIAKRLVKLEEELAHQMCGYL